MEHCLYSLYSKSKDSYYVGKSHDVNQRLIKHNMQHTVQKAIPI